MRNKLFSSSSSALGTGLFRREIGSIISVMFKIRIERNKARKGIDLKFYNVMFNFGSEHQGNHDRHINIVNYFLNG